MAATLRLPHPSSSKLQLRSDLHSLWTSREPLKSLLSSVVATPASEPFLVPWMKSDARFIVCLLSHCSDLDVNHSSILDASSHRVDFLHLLMKFYLTSLWPPSCFFPAMSDTLQPQNLCSSCCIFWNIFPGFGSTTTAVSVTQLTIQWKAPWSHLEGQILFSPPLRASFPP